MDIHDENFITPLLCALPKHMKKISLHLISQSTQLTTGVEIK